MILDIDNKETTSFDVDASPISNESSSDSLVRTTPFNEESLEVDTLPAASECGSDAAL
jgi:hypothetical protein